MAVNEELDYDDADEQICDVTVETHHDVKEYTDRLTCKMGSSSKAD